MGGEIVVGRVDGGGMAVGQLDRSRKSLCFGIMVALKLKGVSSVAWKRRKINNCYNDSK